jgi:hypothetical protein
MYDRMTSTITFKSNFFYIINSGRIESGFALTLWICSVRKGELVAKV